jgi:hypothetical protein
MRLVLGTAVAALMASACAHTVTNEERLDGMTDVTVDSVADASEMRCRDTAPEVQIARDGKQRKGERLSRYAWAIAEAKTTAQRFDEAFKKEPDLVYGPKANEMKRRQAGCLELAATLEKERMHVDLDVEDVEPVKPAPKAVAKVEKVEKEEKPTAAPAKKMETVDAHLKKSADSTASAADDAFGDDTDQLRSAYKKKAKAAKLAKAKAKKKKHVSLARAE